MQCPFCGSQKDKVIDSRSTDGGRSIRRRRQCLSCNRRFTTYERIEEVSRITVIKKDGSRVPYDRGRILAGLQRACYKRPVSDEQLLEIVEKTEESIFSNFDKEVPTSFIGDIVSELLKKLDKIAYIRFASVYREFRDVGQLIEEAQQASNSPDETPGQGILFENNRKTNQNKAQK